MQLLSHPTAATAPVAQPPLLKTWRRRLLYAALSLLLLWHTLAIVIAPAADSVLTKQARKIFGPYLTVLGLNNGWSFFAPDVENGILFRYEVATAGGERLTYIPSDALSWFHPNRRFVRDRFRELLERPSLYADVVGRALCNEHSELKPVSVTLIEIEQKDFRPADRRAGKSPFDPEFLTATSLKTIPCLAA